MKKKLYFFLLAAFLATTSQFAFADITSDLRLHYTFDQVDSTNDVPRIPYFADQSGNKRDGIIEGTITLTNGYGASGKAVALTDTMNRVRVPSKIFEGVTNFTIAYWVNQNALNKWSRILDFGSSQKNYMFIATDGDYGDYLRFEMKTTNKDLQQVKLGRTLTTKKWNHIAITGTYDISAEDTTSIISIYVNGMLSKTVTDFDIAPYMIGDAPWSRLGGSQWQDPTCNSNLDDFRFYSRALTADEVGVLSGVTPEHKAAVNALDIPLEDRTEIAPGTTLALPATTLGYDVVWTTNDPTVISSTGVPVPGDISITDAILTATITPAGLSYPMIEKDFFVSVYPLNTPTTELAIYEFPDENIETRHDTIFVKDEGELAGEAYLGGGAQIVTIGNPAGAENVERFNVYVSDNKATTTANKQFMDLGKTIGGYIHKLNDHMLTIYYRRDTTVDHVKDWSAQGQLFWAFSNTANINTGWGSGGQPWGAMYFEPDECNVSILEGGNETVGVNSLKWGEKNKVKGTTPLDLKWHNITYVQQRGTGYLLVDGKAATQGQMPAPRVQLRKTADVAKNNITGTVINRLGTSLHNDRVSLKNTMLWGFRFYAYSERPDEVESVLGIIDNIGLLNTAQQNTTFNVPNQMVMLTSMEAARRALSIGFKTDIHTKLLAEYAVVAADSASKTLVQEHVDSLVKRTSQYLEYSKDWVDMGKVLKTFDDERALNYPGLVVFNDKIQMAQDAYDAFEVEKELFTFLDDAVFEYKCSQIPTAGKPVDFTHFVANANFEDGANGVKDPKSENGNDVKAAKGWTVLFKAISGAYSKCMIQTNDNPIEGKQDLEVWAGGKVINHTDIYQQLKPLPAGWYVLSGVIRAGGKTPGGQHMYAMSLKDSITYKSDTLEADNRPISGWENYDWGNPAAHKRVFSKFQSKGEAFKIGFRGDTVFYKMDDVRLTYYGATEPAAGELSSLIKNPSFEAGAREAELDGFDATSTITSAAGDVFAPKDWTVLAGIKAPANNAVLNVVAADPNEGANIYRLKGDTLTNVKLSQSFVSPISGIYKVNAYLRADSACRSNARLFADVLRRLGNGKDLMAAVDTSLEYKGWKQMEYSFRAALGDVVTFGVASSGNVDVDNFSLQQLDYLTTVVGLKGTPDKKKGSFEPYAKDGVIYIPNVTTKDRVSVYDIAGRQISVKNPSQIKVNKGMYVIKINNEVIKQLVK